MNDGGSIQDEVRAEAERHANATVAGDFRTAGASLTEAARAQAGAVMKAMPGTLSACEITSTKEGPEGNWLVDIRYTGESGDAVVRSTWAQIEGRLMITGLEVL